MQNPVARLFPRSIRRDGCVLYTKVVESIERAIAAGSLNSGERLPTQRALARHLGTAVGTITRAYLEAERRGLIVGEVGRGTFVSKRGEAEGWSAALAARSPTVDMTISRPSNEGASRCFANALRTLSKRRDLSDLLGDEPTKGWLRHRLAAGRWISGRGIPVSPDQVFACNGIQHALSVIFAALSTAGDVVATEELNYPGIRLLADVYRLRLIGLPMDDEGMRVDALKKACRRDAVKFVLCSPGMHNPTTTTMSLQRRKDLVQVARAHDLAIIENDILGMMPLEPLPALVSLAPERCCYVTGLTKVVAAGLRLGFIVAPQSLLAKLTTAVHSTTWMPSPLMSEIFTMWVEDGSIDEIIDWHRREVHARVELARHALAGASLKYDHAAYHLWLELPEAWRRKDFAALAHSRGVHVSPAEIFIVNRNVDAPHAVRVSVGGLNSRERVRKGLTALARLISEGPPAERPATASRASTPALSG